MFFTHQDIRILVSQPPLFMLSQAIPPSQKTCKIYIKERNSPHPHTQSQRTNQTHNIKKGGRFWYLLPSKVHFSSPLPSRRILFIKDVVYQNNWFGANGSSLLCRLFMIIFLINQLQTLYLQVFIPYIYYLLFNSIFSSLFSFMFCWFIINVLVITITCLVVFLERYILLFLLSLTILFYSLLFGRFLLSVLFVFLYHIHMYPVLWEFLSFMFCWFIINVYVAYFFLSRYV